MVADVLEINGEPRYKLGLIHDPRPPEVPDLATFATTPVPKAPTKILLPKATWPEALNNQLGDCTIAGAVHLDQAGALVVDEPWTYCGDGVTRSTYMGLTAGRTPASCSPRC